MSQFKSCDFQSLDVIGRGTFGTVRRVLYKPTNKIYVCKEISYLTMNNKEKQQLTSEFRILRDLKHPNIVEYLHHEHIQDKQMVNLYMEYCGGGDLSNLIKSYKQRGEFIDETIIWRIFTQVLLALYLCHYGKNCESVKDLFNSTTDDDEEISANGNNTVIHRDIKPDNIFLLDDDYSIKLGDFGLAKCLKHENEFAKTYVGTPYYMSPELLMDKPYDTLCDVWSLGCVMYELCSLTPPFQAKTHLNLQEKIKMGEFKPIPNHYSLRLKMCINACLIVDPMERATVNQLLQDASFKLFRKEWELKQYESEILNFENKLHLKEKKLLKFEECLNNDFKLMNLKFDEIRNSYKKEFNYMLDLQLSKILTDIIGNQQQANHLIKQYSNKFTSPSPPPPSSIQQQQQQQQQQQHQLSKENNNYNYNYNQKLKGPRELNDYNKLKPSPRHK
ncbi:hypothetical protein CANARDRAFT_17295 [[Candida] arabinofermentans NRRL YB-2248]|uniref:non-specific serine/threonine protein kinase n=1 Tax=[Candida] arabinofermentans NRRL YB-2248 TaxID=983967 RepID=A0A1E4T2R3_9ASCO|nr:hypothetical protein CANARDRAFT_17295 [[Candida] arabinofermentans NRRL YB-2248]